MNVVLERGVIICELPKTDMKLLKHDLNGNLHTFRQMGLCNIIGVPAPQVVGVRLARRPSKTSRLWKCLQWTRK